MFESTQKLYTKCSFLNLMQFSIFMPLRIIDVFLYLIICLGATDLGSILCWWIFGRVSSPYNWINASIGLDAAKEFKVPLVAMFLLDAEIMIQVVPNSDHPFIDNVLLYDKRQPRF